MPAKPIHILYIAEFSTGGSVESLLCLVGGVNRNIYRTTVLFFAMPEDRVVDRFTAAGATVLSLFPRATTETAPPDFRKRNLQKHVRRWTGHRGERFYESCKYALRFVRFRLPIYTTLRRKIAQLQPDIVHLNNGARSDTPGILAARRCRVPAVCHVRTFSRLTYINVVAARSVRAFVCISNAVRNTLVGHGIDEHRCRVVPNAVDTDQFRIDRQASATIRDEFGFGSNQRVFALVGRVVSWKGHENFIEAIAQARRTNESIVGLIVGDTEPAGMQTDYMRALEVLVSRLDLGKFVQFAGHRTNIPDFMKAADVVVCPSSEPEPFGRVIIESMAVGTPVIATDAGGATDIIENGINGLLVPLKDSRALAAAMVRLGGESPFADRLSSAGLADVSKHYTVDRHVDHVCEIYASISDSA